MNIEILTSHVEFRIKVVLLVFRRVVWSEDGKMVLAPCFREIVGILQMSAYCVSLNFVVRREGLFMYGRFVTGFICICFTLCYAIVLFLILTCALYHLQLYMYYMERVKLKLVV